MSQALADHLDKLAKTLNETPGYWADRNDCWTPDEESHKDNYLLRYGKTQDADAELTNNLVVMGDLGTTWEPWRAYPTEERTTITGDDLAADLETLKADADDWYDEGE